MAEKTKQSKIQIRLTPEQKDQINRATGKEVQAVELDPEDLEERIAPIRPRC
jgi:hypothetical protein